MVYFVFATHRRFGFLPTGIVEIICHFSISMTLASLEEVLLTMANLRSGVSSIQFGFFPTFMFFKILSLAIRLFLCRKNSFDNNNHDGNYPDIHRQVFAMHSAQKQDNIYKLHNTL